MKRTYSQAEALAMIMEGDPGFCSSSPRPPPPPPPSEEDNFASDSAADTSDSEDEDYEMSASSSSSSSSEDEVDVDDIRPGWTAKNGEVWSPNNSDTTHFIQAPRGVNPGPTLFALARIQDIQSSLNLFFTEEMIDIIVSMTNLNGSRKVKNWKTVDSTELRAYMGLLILSGVYRSKGEATHSLWAERSGRTIFRATMSLGRFHEINSALRFDDRLHRPGRRRTDKLAPIRHLWNMWTDRLPLLFNPGRDVSVDEQLVPFRGRCSFKQYIPKKPAKYGLKIWVTADVSTTYAWKCDIYLGKCGEAREVGQGKRVVLEMTEGLQGVTVTCDNFFTSYSLAQELLKKKIALVGTIKQNKPELPCALLDIQQRPTLSSMFAFTKNTTAVSYIPKRHRNVVLISTKHREAVVDEGEKLKPQIIMDYNRCKGGVDNLDKIVGTYSCRRKTNRWPQRLFCNMLDVSAYNAFVLFTAVEPSWKIGMKTRRRHFLEELGFAMFKKAILRRERIPRSAAAAAMVQMIKASSTAQDDTEPAEPAEPAENEEQAVPSSGGKRGQCKVCKRRTACACISCGENICRDHQLLLCTSCR